MKKLLTLVLVMLSFTLQGYSQESDSSTPIKLEHTQYDRPSERHRAPMRLNIDAYYDAENNMISIHYDGNASGEVYLHCDEIQVGYSPEINTSFLIEQPGLYRIEIVGEGWIATGSILI